MPGGQAVWPWDFLRLLLVVNVAQSLLLGFAGGILGVAIADYRASLAPQSD